MFHHGNGGPGWTRAEGCAAGRGLRAIRAECGAQNQPPPTHPQSQIPRMWLGGPRLFGFNHLQCSSPLAPVLRGPPGGTDAGSGLVGSWQKGGPQLFWGWHCGLILLSLQERPGAD